jgi:hypothetical protein
MKRITLYTCLFLIVVAVFSTNVSACGDRVARFVNIAVDRCTRQDVTLSFDGEVVLDGERTFITISREDGRRLHELLDQRYGKK